jgi:hypothetical protein
MTDPKILWRTRFELLPTKGAEEQADHLPRGAKVAVTCSPTKGIETTLRFSEELLERGSCRAGRIWRRYCGGSTGMACGRST